MQHNTSKQSTYILPESLREDLEKLKLMTEQFKKGETAPEQYRAFRVSMGVYEQREADTFMIRVRFPAGMVLPGQMRVLAAVSKKYGNGILHVTTRQDIQIHQVSLNAIYPALMDLFDAGLSAKGGGGNTVRNIIACHNSGVCKEEIFDVVPYTVALTEFLIPDPSSFQLPRKYKIAFSGCCRDCSGATVNDLGFIAANRDGTEGFCVYAGGGMGARSSTASLLEPFVPISQFCLVAEAVKRVFDKHGNRKDRHKARLRFLIKKIGFDAFRDLYVKEMAELKQTSPSQPAVRPLTVPEVSSDSGKSFSSDHSGDFAAWRESCVTPQRQEGRFMLEIFLPLGDIKAEELETLSDIVAAHGDGMLRATQRQNVMILWVHENELVELYTKLDFLKQTDKGQPTLRNIVACAGASTCKLGICLSRGLAGAIVETLSGSDLDLSGLGRLNINISGCMNACGRHPVAQIGFYGVARRVKGRLVPHYIIQLGGKVEEGKTRLASGKGSVPARNIPAFIRDFLATFLKSPCCPDFDKFLESEGIQAADELVCRYKEVPDFEKDKNFYYDWGAHEVFSLAGRGPGECGAGVFDMIQVDLASSADALEKCMYYSAAALAARALLVTRGEQPDNDMEAFNLFRKHFINQGLIDKRFDPLIESALKSAPAAEPESTFAASSNEVTLLVKAVKQLYDNMDASLKFDVTAPQEDKADKPAATEIPVSGRYDFRGVVCPLNYVKTKLALEKVKGGEAIAVLLDREGAKNVPASAESDGHEVVSVDQEENHWRILIRKSQKNP